MDLNELKRYVFVPNTRLYCVLDGVMVPDLPNKILEAQVPSHCIVAGELTPDMVYAAPYLVYMSPDSKFADWILSESTGKHWGILLHTRRSMLEMRRHFRSLHRAHDESGNPLRFRFYDPRVFNAFLPTCNSGELMTLFGDVDQFFVESPEGRSLLSYRMADGQLRVKELGGEAN